MTYSDSSFFTCFGAISLKRMRRFDLLTTALGHALVVCVFTQITTINLILGAMNNIFHMTSSSSFPLAFPVIWGRRYGCRSSLSSKPCLLHRPLSVLQSACPSCTHPSTLSLVFLFPGIAFVITLLTTWSSSILMTCPYHFSLLFVIFLDACTTFVVPRMCSFLVLSFLVTPHIHLSILISFTSILDSCRLVVAQVSAPYIIASLTTVL